MSGIYGMLNLNPQDSNAVFIQTYGQKVVFDAANQWLATKNAELNEMTSIFVNGDTDAHIERYLLPGSGRMQKTGVRSDGYDVKANGWWDVAYPLEQWGLKEEWDEVEFAYMVMKQVDVHLDTRVAQNINTTRYELLKALFNNGLGSYRTFVDRKWGTLNIRPLANGDSVLYPPIIGYESEATENMYLTSANASPLSPPGYNTAGFLDSGITATNDPFYMIADKLESHFGIPTGGSPIVVFMNKSSVNAVTALPEFTVTTNMHINPGDDVSTVVMPDDSKVRLPGRVLGAHAASSCLLVRWDHIPAGYMFGIHLDPAVPKPLTRRVDEVGTGLKPGLQLVSKFNDAPFMESKWRNRYGFGVGNRLNGVVMQFVPTVTIGSSGGASAGATSLTCLALSAALPSGTTLQFGTTLVTLTAAAAAGATTLAVSALPGTVANNATSTYATPTIFL